MAEKNVPFDVFWLHCEISNHNLELDTVISQGSLFGATVISNYYQLIACDPKWVETFGLILNSAMIFWAVWSRFKKKMM